MDLPNQRAAVAFEIQVFFRFRGRIAHAQTHHKAVKLAFGQRKGAQLLGWVLRGRHQKRLGQAVGFAVHGYLSFFHRFQQGRLHFGRGAVDFVRQHEAVEHGARMEFERAVARHEHVHAEQIGRQHVVGELDALVTQAEHRRQRCGQRGFADAGHVFQQNVSTRQNAGDQLFQNRLFAQDDGVELLE